MAKEKKDKNVKNSVSSMLSASEELSRLLIKLYKSKSFTRAGKGLADMLFKTGIEAGALLSGISELTDRTEKIKAANSAILQLNQTVYIANVMQMADFYRASQVMPLISYIKQVIEGLRELLLNVPATVRKINFRSPVAVAASEIAAAAAAARITVPVVEESSTAVPEEVRGEYLSETVTQQSVEAEILPPADAAEEEKDDGNVQLEMPLPDAPETVAEESEGDGFDDFV